MALASVRGKLDEYLRMPGLNTIELDVKDENGEVGFPMPEGTLPRTIGASKPYYRPGAVAGKARRAGVYLIGRVVVFEDPSARAGEARLRHPQKRRLDLGEQRRRPAGPT